MLADEERFGAPVHHNHVEYPLVSKNLEHPIHARTTSVDWSKVQRIFEMDETIVLTVTGSNRGGLLVDGSDMSGFVPVSHLMEVSCDLSEEEREKALYAYLGRQVQIGRASCRERV